MKILTFHNPSQKKPKNLYLEISMKILITTFFFLIKLLTWITYIIHFTLKSISQLHDGPTPEKPPSGSSTPTNFTIQSDKVKRNFLEISHSFQQDIELIEKPISDCENSVIITPLNTPYSIPQQSDTDDDDTIFIAESCPLITVTRPANPVTPSARRRSLSYLANRAQQSPSPPSSPLASSLGSWENPITYNSRYKTDFEEIETLGQGGFGQVYKVTILPRALPTCKNDRFFLLLNVNFCFLFL